MAVFYARDDGLAASKDQATSPNNAATAMSIYTANRQAYGLDDVVEFSDQGGIYRTSAGDGGEGLTPPSAGTIFRAVSGETPIVTAATVISGGWSNVSGDLWSKAMTAAPRDLFCDDVRGWGRDSSTEVEAGPVRSWYHSAGTLYLNSPGNPDTTFTGRGVEYTNGDSRRFLVTYTKDNLDELVFENLILEKGGERGFNCNGKILTGIYLSNVIFRNNYYSGTRIVGASELPYVLIEDCLAEHNGGHGLLVGNYCLNAIVRRSVAQHNGHFENQTPGDNSHQYTGAIKLVGANNFGVLVEECVASFQNTTFEGTIVTDKGVGIWWDVDIYNSAGNRSIGRFNWCEGNKKQGARIEVCGYVDFHGNTCLDSGEAGIGLASNSVTHKGCRNNRVYNNVSVRNRFGLQVSGSEPIPNGVENNHLANNICFLNTDYQLRVLNAGANNGTTGRGNIYESNCFGLEGGADFIYMVDAGVTTYAAAAAVVNGNEAGTFLLNAALNADPLLNNPAADEFWLQGTSPCIDEGKDLGLEHAVSIMPTSVWAGNVVLGNQYDNGVGWEAGAYIHPEGAGGGVGFFSIEAGPATDGLDAPATTDPITCPADSHIRTSFTVEDTKFVYIYIRYTDANNWVRLEIDAARVVKLVKNVVGTPTTVDTGSTLVDLTAYMFDLVAAGGSIQCYLDGVVDVSGIITDGVAVEDGRVEHDLASNDILICAYPVTGGGALAAHEGSGSHGDPGIRFTQLTDAIYAYKIGYANIFTVGLTTAKIMRWMEDNNLTGGPSLPYLTQATGVFRIVGTLLGNVELGSSVPFLTQTFMQLRRNDLVGWHFMEWVSGETWKLVWVDDKIYVNANNYPAVCGHSAAFTVSKAMLVDLSTLGAKFDGDFLETPAKLGLATDYNDTPAQAEVYDHEVDFFAVMKGVTVPTSGLLRFSFRTVSTVFLEIEIDATGVVRLLDDGTPIYTSGAGAVSSTDNVYLIGDGANVTVMVNNDIVATPTIVTALAGTAGERLDVTDGAAVDIELWPLYADIFDPDTL